MFCYYHLCRLSWQHTSVRTVQFQCPVEPETMHGWMTLYWDKDSMIQFTSQNIYGTIGYHDTTSSVTPDLHRSFREVIESCLFQYSYMPSVNGNKNARRLRLANCIDDINAICRLVQGLADFEKEPDAVNVTSDHYRTDGGFQSSSSEQPLFYCILLESFVGAGYANREMGSPDSAPTSESWYSCGMAFFWVGAKLPQGISPHTINLLVQEEDLFLYLEDLFIEQEHRGGGAGTCMMHALSNVAQSLNCHRMVWQALDWNTPALTFYQEKIGAYIVDGLLSTRFANARLDEFHSLAKNETNDTSNRN
jgi:GNAT superfamily N-acetyltransferase